MARVTVKNEKALRAYAVLCGKDNEVGLIQLLRARNSKLRNALDSSDYDSKQIIQDEINKTAELSDLVVGFQLELLDSVENGSKEWEKPYKALEAKVDKYLNNLSNFKEALVEKPQTKSLIERFSDFWKACAKLIASVFTSPEINLSEVEKQNESLKLVLEEYIKAHSKEKDEGQAMDMNSEGRHNFPSPATMVHLVEDIKGQNLVVPNSEAVPNADLPQKEIVIGGHRR